jgi:hypothetical protein
MDAGGWCYPSDVFGEGHSRPIDQTRALREANGPPGSPVHWHGTIWLSSADHLCRLLGVEMALTQRWSPASDRNQGDVDVRHLLECKVRTGVTRIPAPARALNKVAERWPAMRAPWESPSVVVGGQNPYPEAARFHKITRLNLAELQAAGGDWLE